MTTVLGARERIVAAARDRFARDGVRATSLERVAEQAGCSRTTVYRHFSDKSALVREVLLLDIAAETGSFDEIWDEDAPLADRLVRAFAWAVLAARENPLLRRMTAAEPDLILPALTTEGGEILAMVTTLIAGRLRDEQLPADDAPVLAELLYRLVVSLVLQPYGRLGFERREELEQFARKWVVPAVRVPREARDTAAKPR